MSFCNLDLPKAEQTLIAQMLAFDYENQLN